MKIRLATLWRVPAFCALAGHLCSYAVICFGRYVFIEKVVGPDGVVQGSIDPVRSLLFNIMLFVLFLLLGGLLAFRGMTRAEVAASAAIFAGFSLVMTVLQICVPDLSSSIAWSLAQLQQWSGMAGSWLARLGIPLYLATILSCLTPFLFVLFPKKER